MISGARSRHHVAPAFLSERGTKQCLLILAIYVVGIHGLLLSHDLLTDFAPFLRTDRSPFRYEAIERLLSAGDWHEWWKSLFWVIIPGEYLVQAALYGKGGPLAVVLFQIALQLLADLAVFRIALLLLDSTALSLAAALVYATLPHSLAFTHQLSAEAIAVPLVVIGYWLFLEYRVAGKSAGFLMASGAALGLSAGVRPVLALLPIMAMSFAMRERSRRAAAAAIGFGVIGVMPLALWAGLFWLNTGELSLGNAEASLGKNLYGRVLRISASLPQSDQAAIADRFLNASGGETLSVPGYVSFIAQYPAANLRHSLRDAVTLAAKSGVSRLTIDVFGLAPENADAIQSSSQGWRAIWEQHGLVAAIRSVAATNPAVVIAELVGTALFCLFFLGFLIGLATVAHQVFARTMASERRAGLLLLTLHSFYVFATAQMVDAAQSRHRYPAEFAMCVLAALGAATAHAFYRRHRRAGASATADAGGIATTRRSAR